MNCVCPGIVNTAMMGREYAWENTMTGEQVESMRALWMSVIPMRLFQAPEQAGVVLFLATDAAGKVTGQAVRITEGMF